MTIDRSVFAIIGYKIDTSSLIEEVIERSCEHKFKKSIKFCPKCGIKRKRYKIQNTENILDIFDRMVAAVEDKNNKSEFSTTKNFILFHNIYDSGDNNIYIGYGSKIEEESVKSLELFPYPSIRLICDAFLEKFKEITPEMKHLGIHLVYSLY